MSKSKSKKKAQDDITETKESQKSSYPNFLKKTYEIVDV